MTFPGVIGSFTLKVFDLAVAGAGLTLGLPGGRGLAAEAALDGAAEPTAQSIPPRNMIYLQLVVDRQLQASPGSPGGQPQR